MPEDAQANAEATPEVNATETNTPDYAAIDAAFERAYGSESDNVPAEAILAPDTSGSETTTPTPEVPAADALAENQPEPAAEATQEESGPTIDPSLIALAVQEGADQAALDELVKSDPERANVLLTELQNEVNQATLRTLQGQPNPTGQVSQSEQAATSKDAAKVSALEELLTNEDALAAAKEEHGESYVEKYLLPLAEQAKAFREDREFIQQARNEMEVQKQAALVQQVNSTFASFGKGYEKFYGADPAMATEEQHANRESVTQIADKLRVSDIAFGKPEKAISHYLTQAHAVVSADQVRAAARRELLSQIKTRSATTTARPNRSRSNSSGGPDDVAETAFDRRAAELGLTDYFRD